MSTTYRPFRVIASCVAVVLFIAFASISFVPNAQAESVSQTSYASDDVEKREQMLLMIQRLIEMIAQLKALLEAQQSASYPVSESAVGTYKGYLDGSLFITTQGITKQEALENCELNHSSNPTKTIRCIWNGVEIYPSSSDTKPSLTLLSPNKSAEYSVGDIVPISWKSTGVDKVYINWLQDRDEDESFETVYGLLGSMPQPASGRVNWKVPANIFSVSSVSDRNVIKITSPGTYAADVSPSFKVVASDNVTADAELHVVGVYEATGAQHSFCFSETGNITVKVQKTDKPVILALSSYEPVNWNISLESGAELQKVILGGYNVQTVTGISKSIPVESYTYYTKNDEQKAGSGGGVFYDARYPDKGKYYHWASESTMCPESAGVPLDERVALETNSTYYYAYKNGTSEYTKWVSKLNSLTGLDVASSQGGYSGSSFTVPNPFALNDTATLVSASTVVSESQCVDLKYNMHRGAESPQVLSLQNFLVSKKLLSTDSVTSFYGDLTLAAVKSYQGSVGLAQTGMAYEYTREAIRKETCGH